MSGLSAQLLLDTKTLIIRDVVCNGDCRQMGEEETSDATHLVYPYRVSHPVAGGDACLSLTIEPALLRELVPEGLLGEGEGEVVAFRRQRRRIDPRAQALVALLRHSLHRKVAETLQAETLALTGRWPRSQPTSASRRSI